MSYQTDFIETFLEKLDDLKDSFNHSFSIAPEGQLEEHTQTLLFTLANEHYAVPLDYIREILKVPHITKVPLAPSVILGVMNLNGDIVSISNLCQLFDLSTSPITENSRLIVTKNLSFVTGFLVDSIEGIVEVDEENIQPPLNTLTTVKADFIKGEFYRESDLVILLDMENLVSSSEMQIG